MTFQPLSDLAASLRLQQQSSTLRAQLDQAGQELTTGQAADLTRATGGNLAPVFGIDRQVARLDQTSQDLALAAARSGAAQTALGLVEGASGDLAIGLLGALDRGDPVSGTGFLGRADAALDQVVDALNTRFGGRSLFAGAAGDSTALADADTLRTQIAALVAGAADPASAIAAVDAWFDAPGGGFETLVYGGATSDAAGAPLADGSRLTYLPRADAEELRAVLKPLAMIATVDNAGFSADPDARDAYLGQAAGALLGARDGVTDLRARLGTAEGQIDDARDAASAERNALALARNDLVGVDQFTAAARFSDLEGQLQALYTVTARLSGLSLTNFLR